MFLESWTFWWGSVDLLIEMAQDLFGDGAEGKQGVLTFRP
jgi:hypothetical protein